MFLGFGRVRKPVMRGSGDNLVQTIKWAGGLLLLGLAIGWAGPSRADDAAAAKRFDEQIAPLLAKRCLQCHNPEEKKGGLDLTKLDAAKAGGDSGEVIAPGKLDESALWQRVESDEMPPKKPLDAAEKKLLADWIAGGAVWGTPAIDRFKYTSDARAGYDWWALRPLSRVEPPAVKNTEWPAGGLDRFVLAKLEERQLAPSAEADRRTLIRRLTFDLTGLPPSPEEVAAFVADPDPRAYEKLVERLLGSPDYGERWARHWLDLARFGESNGFEYDEPRLNAWPYRDWVIRALNRDLPFDEFVRQQLAGDALSPGDPEAIKATGFLVGGAYDTAGQSQQSAAMKAVVRQDELEDLVGTTCQTFLALTVNCARCHDHKFDPIRQSEYYRLTSALSGVRHGELEVTTPEEKAAFARRAAESQARLEAVNARIKAIDDPPRAQILAERGRGGQPPETPAPMARWDFDAGLEDSVGSLHGTAQGGARVNAGSLALDGKQAFVSTEPLDRELRAKTLEVWLTVDNLEQSGGGAISVQSLEGDTFDAIVFGEQEPGVWLAGSDSFNRTQSFHGPPESEANTRLTHLAIVYAADGTITAYRNGLPYGESYHAKSPVNFKAGRAQVVFGLRHGSPGGNRMLSGVIDRAQLYDRALSADEVAASAGTAADYVADSAIESRLSPKSLAERKQLLEERTELRKQLRQPQRQMSYVVKARQPEVSHLLVRGDTRQPSEVVSAGGVASVVGLPHDFALPPDAPEAERRAALARWITSADNPLFARVIVNRLWHYHFGVGLVDTPNDFGFNGGRPSHPELLDWLARTLIDEKWSLKQLHRTIVLSATYRQASLRNAAAARQDADNRLLWRKTPQRLEAEVVRDAVLTISGQLNPARGGPGFRDCKEILRSGTFTYEPADPVGPQFNRRSIYRVWTRGGRSALLDTFDCPDPSTTSPKRAVTTTPLQALALLNGSFVLRMADHFAQRVEREAGADAGKQVTRAYQLAYMRDPSAEEAAAAKAGVEQFGLGVLTRAIFNSSEFLYVD